MSLLDRIVKKFNGEDVIIFSEKDGFKEIKSWSHTGSSELDYNLSTFGFPTGIIELAGKSRSGKTTLGLIGMLHFLANNPNGLAVILSSENRDNKDYANKLGLDAKRVLIIKVRYVEKMFLQVKGLINETKVYFKEMGIKEKPKFYFLWDSLGATLSKSELDTMEENLSIMDKKLSKGDDIAELKHEKIGAFAKPAKMFAKFLLGEMYDLPIHFIMLNHQYDKIQGHGRQSTGGEWVELFPCLRLTTALKETIKLDEVVVGQITQVKCEKNDFGPRKSTDIEIILGYGICLSESDITYGVSKGIIVKEGVRKHSFLGGKVSWSTKRDFYNLYYDRNKFLPILHKKIMEARRKDLLNEKYGDNE
jgi:RecA/RadA recombinase